MGLIREVAKSGLRTIVKRNHYFAGYNDGLSGNHVSAYPLLADKIYGQGEDPLMEEGEMHKYYMIGYTAGQTERINELENKMVGIDETDEDDESGDVEYDYEIIPYETTPLSESERKLMVGFFSVLGSILFTALAVGIISVTLGSVEYNYQLNFLAGCFLLITCPCLLAIFSIISPLKKDDKDLNIKYVLFFTLHLLLPVIGAIIIWNINTNPVNSWFIFSYQRDNAGEWLTWGKWLTLIPIFFSLIFYFVKTRDL